MEVHNRLNQLNELARSGVKNGKGCSIGTGRSSQHTATIVEWCHDGNTFGLVPKKLSKRLSAIKLPKIEENRIPWEEKVMSRESAEERKKVALK